MKKVIIIGGSSGMGRELARIYSKNNSLVAVSGRRTELLLSLQNEFPENIFIESFDVTGNENILHLQNMINKIGGLDLLIYSSGFGEPSETLDWETEKQTTQVNVNGFIEIVNFAFNYFVKQAHGQIAGLSSIASVRGNYLAPAYSASKAFMSTYMEGLHKKGAKHNIAVTDIQPGFVKTKMAKGHGQFWVSGTEKASRQIYHAIERKKRRAYISKRWWLIAKLLKYMPYSILKRFM